ncbi:ZPBP2 protein, partial [Galbula dea]|nr:ZPBP2 protein [Galbula dea]
DLLEKNCVYGNTKHEVHVYVEVFTNSPFLVCMDLAGSQGEVIDPKYLWVGPDGKNLEGQRHVNLTETGKLMLTGFKESMSGAYTCTFSHKIIKTTAPEEKEMVEAYKFMVYAYREAAHAYRVFARFTTKECELEANSHFFEELKKILNNIISDLLCHITKASYKCHPVRSLNQGLQHELFVTFQVNPFAPGWEETCHQVPYKCEEVTNRRVQEARDRVGQFFSQQTYVLKHRFQTPPAIHYLDNSFSVARLDSCQPGFGRNNLTSQHCASCCVACEPGTYSPNNDVTCQACPRVQEYGARSC